MCVHVYLLPGRRLRKNELPKLSRWCRRLPSSARRWLSARWCRWLPNSAATAWLSITARLPSTRWWCSRWLSRSTCPVSFGKMFWKIMTATAVIHDHAMSIRLFLICCCECTAGPVLLLIHVGMYLCICIRVWGVGVGWGCKRMHACPCGCTSSAFAGLRASLAAGLCMVHGACLRRHAYMCGPWYLCQLMCYVLW